LLIRDHLVTQARRFDTLTTVEQEAWTTGAQSCAV
jgi:hypothetical protein